jgi:hypothetical protein
MTEIADQVPQDSPGAHEIGFALPERYNASRILFDNLGNGNAERLALTGPAGTRTYRCSSTTPRPIRRRSSARCVRVSCRC